MSTYRSAILAPAVIVATGIVWGFYWIPVRRLAGLGVAGAWGTVAITAAAVLLLTPFVALRRQGLRRATPLAVASVALGGAAFALYSVGLVYGRVAIIILLYFLTPVWSTLIGRYVMGWHTPRMRLLAMAVGLAGLLVMLGATGGMPVPESAGEWMALVAGLMWSVATTGIRVNPEIAPVTAAWIFAAGATAGVLILAPFLEPLPTAPDLPSPVAALTVALGAGGLWWALSIAALMWATVRVEPARGGILLMVEVLVGAGSAALLAGEILHPLEIAGGALVLLAGLLEVWPARRVQSP